MTSLLHSSTASASLQSNADLVDGPNQQLNEEDVSALKAEKHGTEIMEALMSGSTTFAGKTEFSQEKWRKRKAKKYLLYVTARRPTSRLICHVRLLSTAANFALHASNPCFVSTSLLGMRSNK
jgi:tRNA (adenine58-N1)-methyltransferase non-catalytic subunit